jgi:hypothetical protein
VRPVCVLLLVVLMTACSKRGREADLAPVAAPVAPAATTAAPVPVSASNAPAKKEPTTLETAVDGFTGRTAVNTGRKAQDKIRGVVRDRDSDLKDVDSFSR